MITPSYQDSSSLMEMSALSHSGNSLDRSRTPVISDASIKRSIWGPFYYLARCTGLVLYVNSEELTMRRKILHYIPNIVIFVILLINAIYCLTKMSGNVFSINWCYSVTLFMIALHGTVSCYIMMKYKFNNYFENVILYIRTATRNNVSHKFDEDE